MKQAVTSYLLAARTGGKVLEPSTGRHTQGQDSSTPMQVDAATKGKKGKDSKGKGGGKKGTGKVKGEDKSPNQASDPRRFEGYCGFCGKCGHRQRDCYSNPKGGKSGRPRVNAVGKQSDGAAQGPQDQTDKPKPVSA
eukprot:776969-Alexandrium_andersonii.AAC.1